MRYRIGLDPDIDKSGVAVWDTQKKCFVSIEVMEFFDLLEMLSKAENSGVHLEAAWLHAKSNWHASKDIYIASRIAKNVGANHQIGKLIETYCIRNKIPHQLHKPESKKLDAETFKKLTGWKGYTNSEKRDAAMLVFGR